jgi:hypothetical protein
MTTPRKFRAERFPRKFIPEQLVSCPMESDRRIEFRSVAKTLHQAKDPPASASAWEMIEATAPRRLRAAAPRAHDRRGQMSIDSAT